MKINALAGKKAEPHSLINVPHLVSAYYTGIPDPRIPAQRVAFGTSGHRGSAAHLSFNERHILAIVQAICFHRKWEKTDGPLFLGFDTHALSAPAFGTAMEVLAANGVEVMIAEGGAYTPTPVISHAILRYNKGRKTGLADGIVITPSHNPPGDGGIKYNAHHGGPAQAALTQWIEAKANELLKNLFPAVKRVSLAEAMRASSTHAHNYLQDYVLDLGHVIDMESIRAAQVRIGVDPMGGAGLQYWEPIADHYQLDLTVVNKLVDPTFGFMSLDWDGQIRMDPSSVYAMQPLIALKDQFDIALACDTDHDRHGIVTPSVGLMPANDFLCVALSYLLGHRLDWKGSAAVGKTMVTTQLIDRIATKFGRKVYATPVGFKWFVDGLLDASLCFAGEESAGASFSRMNGEVWTTDKDGFIPGLLAAEITAVMGADPGIEYQKITTALGAPSYQRIEAKANAAQKERLGRLSVNDIQQAQLGGEDITHIEVKSPANDAALGGLKVSTANAWFAARPSGTEDIYKIYAESFLGPAHLETVLAEAQTLVDAALQTKAIAL